jgi:1-acyl-sn-glycerol-3-phosphate acyltransferase
VRALAKRGHGTANHVSQVKGVLATAFIVVNTIWWASCIYLVGAVRALLPNERARVRLSIVMSSLADGWVRCNKWMLRVLRITRIEANWNQASGLSPRGWQIIISNHQGWSDILVLQTMFLGKVPPLKFFVKRVLIWIPGIGLAMWLLGFPYVRRFPREQLEANPTLRQIDRAATLKACEVFKRYPASVLNFVEGTRFTAEKHAAQTSRYARLLMPKTGGLGYVIAGLGNRVNQATDVTIYYPSGVPTFWDFLCGKCSVVRVDVRSLPIPMALQAGGDELSEEGRDQLRHWVDEIWSAKDARLGALNGQRA